MILKRLRWVPTLLLVPLLVSCGGGSYQAGSHGGGGNYKEVKSMVLDILKSEEGRKAVMQASRGQLVDDATRMKLMSTEAGTQIQMAVKEILTAQDQDKLLRQLMTDPKFAGDFAKAIQEQNKQIQKDLMKDPEYQKSVLEAMKNPDFEKQVLDLMKTAPYRQQTMAMIQEALQNPLYKAQLLELMNRAVQEQTIMPTQDGGGKQQGAKKQSGKKGDQDKQQQDQDKQR